MQERLARASIQITMDTYGHLFPSADDGSELADAEPQSGGWRCRCMARERTPERNPFPIAKIQRAAKFSVKRACGRG